MGMGVVDQIIIGTLGTVAIAAVGLTNTIIFLATITFASLGAGSAILVAQYYGSANKERVSIVTTLSMSLGLFLGIAFALPLIFFGSTILSFMGAEQAVVAAGGGYFAVVSATLPLILLAAIMSHVFRALENSRLPMFVTLPMLFINTVLSIVLVFGFGPVPAFGLVGAAYATLIAQSMRVLALALLLQYRQDGVRLELASFKSANKPILKRLFKLTYPITLSEMFWGLGIFLYTMLFARLGTEELAASQIVIAVESVFIVASSGLSIAALTLVGQEIGSSRMVAAQEKSNEIVAFGIYTSIVFGLLLAAVSPAIRLFYPAVAPSVVQLTIVYVLFNALFQPAKVLNMILGNGILPSGGDTKFVLFADIFSLYAIGLPLAYFMGFMLDFGIFGVFAGRVLEELVRLLLLAKRFRENKWQQSLAEEGPPFDLETPTS
jgi:putative MATE family efflux protein